MKRELRSSVLKRKACFTVVFLALLVGFDPSTNWAAGAEQTQDQDYFHAYAAKTPLLIQLDQIGILAAEEVTAVDVKEFTVSLNMSLLQEYPGRIFILSIGKTLPRSALVKLAREIQKRGEKLVVQAGLVTTPLGAEAPMLVTDQFIVQFQPGVSREKIEDFNKGHAVQTLLQNPFVKNQYLLRVTEASRLDALAMSNRYQEKSDLVQYAHPNFIRVTIDRETILNDPLFGNQWPHRNTGQSAGTADADVDTSWAWDITQGQAAVVIGVIDGGFDITHPDLTPNFWTNPGEIPGNGIDDDGNSYTDDVNGWDFTGCDVAFPPPGCGDNNPTGGSHGTAVAGAAAARGNNTLGVTGSCPNCRLMLVRRPTTDFAQGLAFNYVQQMGAQIITNSWGFAVGTPCTTNLCTAINNAATGGRGGLGSVVLFAMNNPNVNDCIGASPDISSLANVIAVSRASNRDRFDLSGFGNCMDLLAPSAGLNTVPSGRGTLWAPSTDVQGNAGYNINAAIGGCPSAEPAPTPANLNARDYTLCFNGTSYSAPLTAGVAGLILAASPNLTRLQVQQLLQDTADKIEDSAGAYSPNTGFSSPATGQATHGWGRVNAIEAVRVAAPVAQGGRGGVDVFLRDNRLDWGNTEQPSNTLFEATRGYIGHWQSMDIKVDAPPYAVAPTAATFDTFIDETPSAIPGDINRVYVRVRNRGPVTAATVNVKLHWTQFGTALAALPADFWTAFPNNSTDTSQWHPLDCATAAPAPLPSTVCQISNLAYSGASVAGSATDAAQILRFEFPAPTVDPMLANHFCLLAMADSAQDPISDNSKAISVVDTITPTDNNVTHRNYSNLPTGGRSSFRDAFLVRNPFDRAIRSLLSAELPEGWRIEAEPYGFGKPFSLSPGQEVLVTVQIAAPAPGLSAEVPISQAVLEKEAARVIGGVTLQFRPEVPADVLTSPAAVTPYLIGTFDLREGARSILQVLNPTGMSLRVLLAFFDDNEKPLRCLRDKLSANDMLEIDVLKEHPGAELGVVKVVALHPRKDAPQVGIVGNQRLLMKGGATETVLHPVSVEILETDWPIIKEACMEGK